MKHAKHSCKQTTKIYTKALASHLLHATYRLRHSNGATGTLELDGVRLSLLPLYFWAAPKASAVARHCQQAECLSLPTLFLFTCRQLLEVCVGLRLVFGQNMTPQSCVDWLRPLVLHRVSDDSRDLQKRYARAPSECSKIFLPFTYASAMSLHSVLVMGPGLTAEPLPFPLLDAR